MRSTISIDRRQHEERGIYPPSLIPINPRPKFQKGSVNVATCDAYVYYFLASNGPNGEKILSTRSATLEATGGRGEPVMESQLVIDDSELDEEGFLVTAVGNDSNEIDDISAQIWSLEVRAASRDNEAIDTTEGAEKYMLSLESRELRRQAQSLRIRRTEFAAGELNHRIDMKEFTQFAASAAPE